MASLTAHLRRTDDHGRLGFHPECPICRRDRLAGAPPANAIVGPRNKALLAASVLALSTASPTSALAADPDQEVEGTAAPEQVANDPVQPAPAFDPGGQSTELSVDVAPPPEANAVPEADAVPDATGDTAPLEQEPAMDEVAPVVDAGDMPAVEQEEPAPAAEPLPQPPSAEPLAPEPPAAPPVQQAPAVTQQEPQVVTNLALRVKEQPPRVRQRKKAPAPAPAVAPAPPPAPAGIPAPPKAQPVAVPAVTSSSTSVRVARATDRERAQPADRFHVVQRGESLWSIAKDVLGDDASVARIAREVNRLWELNSERIGTGEPDLVMSGTRIALR